MKQKTYILGLITTVIIFIGTMFKANHWPGASYLLAIGMAVLVLVFLPAALRNHYITEGKKQNLMLYIVTWLTCLVVFTGMLFKILHWPGAGYLLILALPFPYVVFLPVFLIVTSKKKDYSVNNTVFVLFLLAAVSVFSVLLALNVSKEKIDDSLGLARSYNRVETVLNSIDQIDNQTPVIQKIDEVLKIVDNYQFLILKYEGFTEEQWNNDPLILQRPEFPTISTPALVVYTGENAALDTRLEADLNELINLIDNTPGYKELARFARDIIDFNEPVNNEHNWTGKILQYNTMSWSLIYLDGLETNLKLLRISLASLNS
jgi:hypothetical protein